MLSYCVTDTGVGLFTLGHIKCMSNIMDYNSTVMTTLLGNGFSAIL